MQKVLSERKHLRLKENFVKFDNLLKEFAKKTSDDQIFPNLIVFSAGILNVITEKFALEGISSENKFFIGNQIDYETKELKNKNQLISSFTKTGKSIPEVIILFKIFIEITL